MLDPDDQLGYLVARVADRVSRPWFEAMRAHGINPRQFSVLALLVREPRLSQGELARRVMITPQSLSESLAALVQDRLIVREPGGPGLPSLTRVTAAGEALLRRAFPVIERTNREAFAPLSQREQKQLRAMLQKLLGATHSERGSPPRTRDSRSVGVGVRTRRRRAARP